MKNNFKNYIIGWSILLVLFNIIAFVSVGWINQEKYTASFWIGYLFITVAFIGQLCCANFAFKETNSTKLFYKLSIVKTSYTGLVLTLVFGGLCMIISPLPYWVGIILCSIVLALNAVSVVKAHAVAEIVSDMDDKIKQDTAFIKNLRTDAESLISKAKSDTAKTCCKKVYEVCRYSDPKSSPSLNNIETQISNKFSHLSRVVMNGDDPAIQRVSEELIGLVETRNSQCKNLK